MDTSTLSFCCSALTSLIDAGSVANGPSMTVTDSPTSKSTSIGVRSIPPVSAAAAAVDAISRDEPHSYEAQWRRITRSYRNVTHTLLWVGARRPLRPKAGSR